MPFFKILFIKMQSTGSHKSSIDPPFFCMERFCRQMHKRVLLQHSPQKCRLHFSENLQITVVSLEIMLLVLNFVFLLYQFSGFHSRSCSKLWSSGFEQRFEITYSLHLQSNRIWFRRTLLLPKCRKIHNQVKQGLPEF